MWNSGSRLKWGPSCSVQASAVFQPCTAERWRQCHPVKPILRSGELEERKERASIPCPLQFKESRLELTGKLGGREQAGDILGIWPAENLQIFAAKGACSARQSKDVQEERRGPRGSKNKQLAFRTPSLGFSSLATSFTSSSIWAWPFFFFFFFILSTPGSSKPPGCNESEKMGGANITQRTWILLRKSRLEGKSRRNAPMTWSLQSRRYIELGHSIPDHDGYKSAARSCTARRHQGNPAPK